MLDLLKDCSIEQITVSSLTQHAKLHRSTFYLHYREIQDVWKSLIDSLIEELLRDLQQDKNCTLYSNFHLFFQWFKVHPYPLEIMLMKDSNSYFSSKLIAVIQWILDRYLCFFPTNNKAMQTAFFTYAIYGVLTQQARHSFIDETTVVVALLSKYF